MNKKEINDLVAEKVMGYVRSKFKGQEGWGTKDQHRWFSHFNPSGDISDAWLVAEKFDYVHLFRMDDWNENKYECKLIFDNERSFYGIGETAPIAICLAAFKALGIDIKGI
jgi:hypothetical protein